MRRFAVLGALLLILAAAAFAQTTIPFRLIDNRVIVPITVNGYGPFLCIIDTGANSVISSALAKRLGISFTARESDGGVGEQPVLRGSVVLSSIHIAPRIEFHDIDTSVLPLDDMQHVFGSAKIDAIFGTPLFERYAVTIDYDRKELTLADRGAATSSRSATVLRIDRAGIPVTTATLDGVPGRFGLDLGARSALLLYTPFVEKNGLRSKYHAHFETITGWGIGGPVHSQIARAQSLKLGAVDVRSIVIRLSTQKSGATTGSHLDGLIGPDVFRQFRTTFDYANKRVILEKGPQFGKPDSYDHLGAWLGQENENFVVLDIIPGGPAEQAGLRKGDLVVAIDGAPTSQMLLPDVRTNFRNLPPGQNVRFSIQRADKKLSILVTLRDLV